MHGIFLLVHYIVVHFCSEDPALVQKPSSLNVDDVLACFEHIG
jgi:hypothetical protein